MHDGDAEFDDVEFFRKYFRGEVAEQLVNSAALRSEGGLLQVLRELQYADSAFTDAETRVAGTGAIDYIVSFVRAYRATDWFRNELQVGITEAFLEPFRAYFAAGAKPKLRCLLNRDVRLKLRRQVLERMHGDGEVLERLLTDFFEHIDPVRHLVIHGLETPTPDQCRAWHRRKARFTTTPTQCFIRLLARNFGGNSNTPVKSSGGPSHTTFGGLTKETIAWSPGHV